VEPDEEGEDPPPKIVAGKRLRTKDQQMEAEVGAVVPKDVPVGVVGPAPEVEIPFPIPRPDEVPAGVRPPELVRGLYAGPPPSPFEQFHKWAGDWVDLAGDSVLDGIGKTFEDAVKGDMPEEMAGSTPAFVGGMPDHYDSRYIPDSLRAAAEVAAIAATSVFITILIVKSAPVVPLVRAAAAIGIVPQVVRNLLGAAEQSVADVIEESAMQSYAPTWAQEPDNPDELSTMEVKEAFNAKAVGRGARPPLLFNAARRFANLMPGGDFDWARVGLSPPSARKGPGLRSR